MLDKAKTPTLAKDHHVSHSILLPKSLLDKNGIFLKYLQYHSIRFVLLSPFTQQLLFHF